MSNTDSGDTHPFMWPALAAFGIAIIAGLAYLFYTGAQAPLSPAFSHAEVFTLNLADRDRTRYVQMAISFECANRSTCDHLEGRQPALRSRIVNLVTARTSADISTPEGKEQLRAALLAIARKTAGEAKLPGSADTGDIRDAYYASFLVQ